MGVVAAAPHGRRVDEVDAERVDQQPSEARAPEDGPVVDVVEEHERAQQHEREEHAEAEPERHEGRVEQRRLQDDRQQEGRQDLTPRPGGIFDSKHGGGPHDSSRVVAVGRAGSAQSSPLEA